MGNVSLTRPSNETVRFPDLLDEIRKCHLMQVHEAYQFFLKIYLDDSDSKLNRKMFEEVFGQLVDDTDKHFQAFSHSESESESACDPYELFCIFALLASEPIRPKIEFMYNLHEDKRFRKLQGNDIQLMFQRAITVLSCLFHMETVLESELFPAVTGLINFFKDRKMSSETLEGKGKGGKEIVGSMDDTDDFNGFDLVDFVQFCQDTKDIWRILDAVNILSSVEANSKSKSRIKKVGNKPALIIKSIKSLSETHDNPEPRPHSPMSILQRPRHPLWQYCALDMMEADESWLSNIPAVTAEDMVFCSLEILALSSKQAIPVFYRTDNLLSPRARNWDGSADEQITRTSSKDDPKVNSATAASVSIAQTSSSVKKPSSDLFPSSPGPSLSGRKSFSAFGGVPMQLQAPAGSLSKPLDTTTMKFMGLVDIQSIVGWIVACCPSLVTSAIIKEEKQKQKMAEEQLQGKRRESTALRKSTIVQDPKSNMNLRASVVLTMSVATTRNREKTTASKDGSVWQTVGETIAMSFNQTAMDNEFVSKSPKPSESSILQMDQFIYDVIDMIARGYRGVPLAAAVDRPQTVTHVITDVDVARFLSSYAGEILGSLSGVEVAKSGLMKRPLCIQSSTNYGSALMLLASKGVDLAAILDDSGKVAGKFSVDTVKSLWYSWKQQTQRFGAMTNLELMKKSFADGTYQVFDGSTAKVFSIFSILLSPLKMCESVGVSVADFDSCIKVAVRKPQSSSFAEDEEDEDDDKSTDDSDSDTDSSDSSGSRKRRKKKSQKQVANKSATGKVAIMSGKGRKTPLSPRAPGGEGPAPPQTPRGSVSASSPRASIASVGDASKSSPRKAAGRPSVKFNSKKKIKAVVYISKPSTPDDKAIEEAERRKKLAAWYNDIGVIQPHDTLGLALDVMSRNKSSRVLVVTASGHAVGIVSVADICQELIRQEAQVKTAQFEQQIKDEMP